LLFTALACLFRSLNLALWDYAFLRYPIPLGMGLSESVILVILPPITLFNLTEPLYVVPLGYLIADRVGFHLKLPKST